MILLLLFSFVSLIKCLSIQQYDKINCCIEDTIYRLIKSLDYDALDASIKVYGSNINKDIIRNLFDEDINIINYLKYYAKLRSASDIYANRNINYVDIFPIIDYILNNRNYTTLARIIAHNDANIIRLLITNEYIEHSNALIHAIINNNINMVRVILGINKPIKFNFMISLASAIGNTDIIELLLKDNRFSPEHSILTAAYYGRIESIKILINNTSAEKYVWTCFMKMCPTTIALENKHFNIVDYILSSYTYQDGYAKKIGMINSQPINMGVEFTITAINNGYSNVFTNANRDYMFPYLISCDNELTYFTGKGHGKSHCSSLISDLINKENRNIINKLYKQTTQTDNIYIMKGLIDNLWDCRHEDLQRMLSMFEPNKWTAMELLAKKCNDFNTFK